MVQAETLCCHVDGHWNLTAPAQEVIDRLRPCFHNEGGSVVARLQQGCGLIASWAPRHRRLGHEDHMQLPAFPMPAADSVDHELSLHNQHSTEAAHVLKIYLQPVPKGLRNVSIEKRKQSGRTSCRLGKPVFFRLVLQDHYGSAIPEPSRWFKLQKAAVLLSSGEHLVCHLADEEGWHCFNLSGLTVGFHQLKCECTLEPLHPQQQQYAIAGPIDVPSISFQVEVFAGEVAKLRPKIDYEVQELGKMPLRLTALDICGNRTSSVPKDMAFKARCEGREARPRAEPSMFWRVAGRTLHGCGAW